MVDSGDDPGAAAALDAVRDLQPQLAGAQLGIQGEARLEPGYWRYGLPDILLNVAANLLFLHAVRVSPLSLTIPFLSFTPVFSALSASVLLGEWPSGSALLGIVMELSADRLFWGVDARLVLGTGALGGFTTYSSFNLETLRLAEQGAWDQALEVCKKAHELMPDDMELEHAYQQAQAAAE